MELAPIVLFVYNRPWHTRQTLEALSKNDLAEKSKLFIFADGPKNDANDEDLKKISEVRSILKEKKWCGSVEIHEEQINKGLNASIIQGITTIVNQFEKVIVVEDDIITSRFFLTFLNEGLEMYKNSSNVYSVNGYMFPIKTNQHHSFLMPGFFCWGWGTWKNKWGKFNVSINISELIYQNYFLVSRFNLGNYNYTNVLKTKSWDIIWYYIIFIHNGLSLFPSISLTENIGFDGTGTNYTFNTNSNQLMTKKEIPVEYFEIINLKLYSKVTEYFSTPKSYKTKDKIARLIKFYIFEKIKKSI